MTRSGARARIATVCQAGRFFDTVEENRAHVFDRLDVALSYHPDLVCLPENFTTVGVPNRLPETVAGSTVDAVSKRARRHNCYIVCPLLIASGSDDGGVVHNSAVIVGRSGEIIGIYEKRRPVTSTSDFTVLEAGVTPGAGAGVFDLDFGRVGIRICFDVGFSEDWSALQSAGARLVVWPSAYDGGSLLSMYAQLHRYWVVTSVRTDRSRIIDPCGETLAETDSRVGVAVRDVNLDFAVCHYDFNWSIPTRILGDYAGRVDIRSHWDAGMFVVEPTDPSITIANLMNTYGFESWDQYHERHRSVHAALIHGDAPNPQSAAHGARNAYEQ